MTQQCTRAHLQHVWRMSNGVTTYHNYNDAAQVSSLLHVGPAGLLQAFYYEYDGDGRPWKLIREDNTRVYYEYDAAHRLTAEKWLSAAGAWDHTFYYTYDSAGNRSHFVDGTEVGAGTYYTYNSLNQLTHLREGGVTTYCYYTPDGNMSGTDVPTDLHRGYDFTWNSRDELAGISYRTQPPGAPSFSAAYTAAGQRCFQAGVNGYYCPNDVIYDGAKVIAEVNDYPSAITVYVNEGSSPGSRLLMKKAEGYGAVPYYFLCDALGNITGWTDDDGTFSSAGRYDAFGRMVSGSSPEPFGFAGGYGYYTTSTGLIHAWHRWYDPQIGKWLSQDPIGSPGGNPYTYVGDLPTVWVDPMGLQPKWYRDLDWGAHIPYLGNWAEEAGTAWGRYDAREISGWDVVWPTTKAVGGTIVAGFAIEQAGAYAVRLAPELWTGESSGLNLTRVQRFFYDARPFKSAISREYWNPARQPAAGRALHHLFFRQTSTLVPQGIRNAGFNLLELPAWNPFHPALNLNTWLGWAPNWGARAAMLANRVEWGIRVGVPTLAAIDAYISYRLGRALAGGCPP